MKKLILSIAIASICTVVLSSCGGQEPEIEPVKIEDIKNQPTPVDGGKGDPRPGGGD